MAGVADGDAPANSTWSAHAPVRPLGASVQGLLGSVRRARPFPLPTVRLLAVAEEPEHLPAVPDDVGDGRSERGRDRHLAAVRRRSQIERARQADWSV